MITFSGHGGERHELVTHDVRVDDLVASTVQLARLIEWFCAIPARHLVSILDAASRPACATACFIEGLQATPEVAEGEAPAGAAVESARDAVPNRHGRRERP